MASLSLLSHRQAEHAHTHDKFSCTHQDTGTPAPAHMAMLGMFLGNVVASRTLHRPQLCRGHRPHDVCVGNCTFLIFQVTFSKQAESHTELLPGATWVMICHSEIPSYPSMVGAGRKLTP